jgi:hypothetical protein
MVASYYFDEEGRSRRCDVEAKGRKVVLLMNLVRGKKQSNQLQMESKVVMTASKRVSSQPSSPKGGQT